MKPIYIIILIFLIILCLINIKLYEVDGRIYFENLYKPNYNLLNKRVAICISGQIRTGYDKTLLLQKIFLIDSLNADVFCCFEDTNEEIKQFIKDNLKPKKIIYVNNIPKDPQCNIDYGAMSMYNKIYLANKLKKEYEIDNNFIYDYVIRIRPDLVVKEHLPPYIFNINYKNNIYMPMIINIAIIFGYPDFMAISNSHNMDIYSDIFNYLSNFKNNKIYASEPLLYMYLNKQKIKGIIFDYPINLIKFLHLYI